MLKLNRKS